MSRVSSLLNPVREAPPLREVRSALEGVGAPICLGGLTRTAKALIVASLGHELGCPIVVLTSDNETADRLSSATRTFLRWLEPETPADAVASLPAYDCSPYESRSPHAEIAERRALALWGIARGSVRVLIASLAAALGRFRESSYYGSLAVDLKAGDEVPLEDLVSHLNEVGYENSEPVSTVGQFSLRGGILDVCPPSSAPARMEFFGDRLESLRTFNLNTQRSEKTLDRALILPLMEHKRTPQLFAQLIERLKERSAKPAQAGREPDWTPEYAGAFPGWEFYVSLAEPHRKALFGLFERPCLVWEEPAERFQQLRSWRQNLEGQYEEVRDAVPARPRPEEIFLTEEE